MINTWYMDKYNGKVFQILGIERKIYYLCLWSTGETSYMSIEIFEARKPIPIPMARITAADIFNGHSSIFGF